MRKSSLPLLYLMGLVLFIPNTWAAEEAASPVLRDDIPLIRGSLESVLLGGAEADEDLVPEGMTGSVTLGGAGVSLNRKSSKFGEYTGIDDSTGYFVGDADLSYFRDNYFMDFTADNLGLDNRKVTLETGKLNDYEFTASFDQATHLTSSASKSIFEGIGSGSLTLPAGFATNADTSGMTITGVKDVELEIDGRDTTSLSFSRTVDKNEYSLSFKRETKKGLQGLGAPVLNAGSFPDRATILPQTIDQTTTEAQISFAHNGEDSQFQLGYMFSLYDNHEETLDFVDPFGRASGIGRMSGAPDTLYHKISFSGGMNLSETSRVSGVLEYGLMQNNERLLDFSVNSSVRPSRDTTGANFHTFHMNLMASSSPMDKLNLSARFKHYQTLNDTQRDVFLPIVNDSNVAQVAIADEDALANQAYDTIQDLLNLDASYRLLKSTNLNMGYDVELFHRDLRDVEQTVEQTFRTSLRTRYSPNLSAKLKFSFANRRAGKYDPNITFQSLHSAEYIATSPANAFDNSPDLRMVDMANRERLKLGANISYTPSEKIIMGFGYNFKEDDFKNTTIGVSYIRNQTAMANIDYSPDETKSFYAFYNYNVGFTDQRERTTGDLDTSRDFTVAHADTAHTVGLGSRMLFLDKKLMVNTSYSFTHGVTETHLTGNTTDLVGGVGEVPDDKSMRHTVEVLGEYKIRKNMSVGLSYQYENFLSNDFATDIVDSASTSLDRALLLSEAESDYEGHQSMIYITYTFDKL